MNRRRQDVATVRISDEEYSRLESKFEALKNEFTACRRKLDSKCEALLILSQELDQCRSERDQFKLMAEQLRERCQTLKRSMSGKPKQSTSDTGIYKNYTDTQSQNLARLLYESKEYSKSLQFEVDDLKQKLHDAQGDIKLLREQIARSRVGTTDEGMSTRHFPAHEREELVQKLESANEQYLQLERDLQTVLDEKEELVTERDVYKTKYERLNQELNYILKGDENRVVDIDALVMENKYLSDRLKQMEEERSMAMAAVSKYKSLLEKKKSKSSMKLGQTRGGGMIITQKQVQQVLESKQSVLPSQQAMSDLQALAGALLDSVNDKNLALSHQRKTNKILGNRVAELEKKIKTLECAGLWNIPANVSSSLEKLKQDCDDMKMLIPRKHSDTDSERLSPSEGDRESELETVTPLDSTDNSPMTSPLHVARTTSSQPKLHGLDADLDLLPTKEVPTKPQHAENCDTFQYPATDIYGMPSIDRQTVQQFNDHDIYKVKGILLSTDLDSDVVGAGEKHSVERMDAEHKHVLDETVEENTTNLLGDMNGPNNAYDIGESIEHNSHLSAKITDAPQSVHVYNQDKLEETVDGQEDDDEEVKFADGRSASVTENVHESNAEDIDDTNEELNEFYDDDDAEASEKVGLLMESVTKKMCNISHHGAESKGREKDKHGTDSETECESVDTVKCRTVKRENERSLSQEAVTDGRPLLGSQRNSVDENLVNSEEPHDIEC